MSCIATINQASTANLTIILHLLFLRDEFCEQRGQHVDISKETLKEVLTLNIRDALIEDALQDFWVFQLFLYFGNDALSELLLLALFLLTLETNPRIQDGLSLGSDGRLLL